MLHIEHLSKTFNTGEKPLYNDLSLTVDGGSFVAVIGGNGAGKSTLFKCVANEVPYDAGHVTLNGVLLTGLPAHVAAQRIAVVRQDPTLGTVGTMTVFENLSLAARKGRRMGLRKCLVSSKRTFFKERLEAFGVGLETKLDVPASALSGGQRQVLNLLMATLVAPDLLLLDEHTAALDPKTATKVMAETARLVAENHLTCVMITHDLADAARYGTRLLMFDSGTVALDISGEEKARLTADDLAQLFHSETAVEMPKACQRLLERCKSAC